MIEGQDFHEIELTMGLALTLLVVGVFAIGIMVGRPPERDDTNRDMGILGAWLLCVVPATMMIPGISGWLSVLVAIAINIAGLALMFRVVIRICDRDWRQKHPEWPA